MTGLVEILLSTHNGEAHLVEQIESIIGQTHKNWRIIARDDGSSDTTALILRKYSLALGNQFVFLDDMKGNLGIVQSYARLINYSSATYIAFCDQDDVWFADKIEGLLAVACQAEDKWGPDMPLLIHTDLMVTDCCLNPIAKSFWCYQNIDPSCDSINRLLVQNTVTACSAMINRATIQYLNGIPEYAIMHDWWIALICSVFGKIITINKPTLYYRQHSMNDTGAKKWGFRFIANKMNSQACQKSIVAKQKQSLAFLESFEDRIDSNKLMVIKIFAQINKDGWLKKRYNLLKYKIGMQGLFRNIAFIAFV